MFSAREHFKEKLNKINKKINSGLDFDFTAVSKRIETLDDFNNVIMANFFSGKQLFYRGERINDPNRNLLPTMLRNPDRLFSDNDLGVIHIDGNYVYNYYASLGNFVSVFNKTMGLADADNLYEICAFAQHYYHFSPLIDFTKSVYPSLSFALKNRDAYDDDIVLYVLELKNDNDYTTDINIANEWLKSLDIYVSCFDEDVVKRTVKEVIENKELRMTEDFRQHLERLNTRPLPKAKLIDIPSNTRMKFQQGVFLMLTDFQLFNVKYFTKNLREQFSITKFIINKDICPQILQMIECDAPWYNYKYLTDVEAAFKIAVEE